ncbi:MAG: glycosyltransferase family protein [Betaproteobacteria bacterium]|nr:glycosyltransferase family protein [Betaproteobacteria bacterium]
MIFKVFRGRRADGSAPLPFSKGGNSDISFDAAREVHALIDAGDLAEAERRIAPLAAACPSDPDLQFLLGRLALKKGDNRAAAEYFENAVTLRPDWAAAHVELAKLYTAWREPARAQACYQAALKVAPDVAGLHNNLGLIHLDQARLPEAEHCFERALQLKPDFATAKNNLGRVYRERKQYDTALACFRAALALDPGDIHASINIGLTLSELGEHEQALAQLQTCHRVAPGRTVTICGLGKTNFELGRMPQARQYFREALALDADCADAHFGLANVALLQGDLAAGWEGYEWRTRMPRFAQHYSVPEPRWGGERLNGKTLLVNAEQGYGDILMFARFLSRIGQPDATVVFRCRPALVRLLRDFPGLNRVVDAEAGETVAADATIPLLSLGRALGIGLADLPGPIPYLRALPGLVQTWRAKLAGDTRLRAGLAWGGNPLRRHQHGRTPPVDDYHALAAVPGVAFYNLQPGCSADDIARFPLPLIDLTPGIADFADTAALVANLDLVISVDTSVAHLCGAMGRPTWLLHSGVPDWRWEIAGAESPWYPTVRLFRRRDGGWIQALTAVADALHEISRSRLKS